MIDAEFRPIETWPGIPTKDHQRQQSRFSTSWSATLAHLDKELRHLGAKRGVIEVALRSNQIRLDGWPKADARAPEHPGVIISFESKHGPLRYATDEFKGNGNYGYLPGWQANVRAIALSLEALRSVDRYGVSGRGEQYTGWSALPPGTIAAGAATMTLDEASQFLVQSAGYGLNETERLAGDGLNEIYRRAAKRLHPDTGGTTEQFQKLEEAKRVLDGGAP